MTWYFSVISYFGVKNTYLFDLVIILIKELDHNLILDEYAVVFEPLFLRRLCIDKEFYE